MALRARYNGVEETAGNLGFQWQGELDYAKHVFVKMGDEPDDPIDPDSPTHPVWHHMASFVPPETDLRPPAPLVSTWFDRSGKLVPDNGDIDSLRIPIVAVSHEDDGTYNSILWPSWDKVYRVVNVATGQEVTEVSPIVRPTAEAITLDLSWEDLPTMTVRVYTSYQNEVGNNGWGNPSAIVTVHGGVATNGQWPGDTP